MASRIIALLTDFGERDYFVAAMKAVILSINPGVQLIDITHDVPSFDRRMAAFILRAVYNYFPEGTIFLVVIDPGVGSERKILLARTQRHFFVGPDNGVLSPVLEAGAVIEVREVKAEEYFLQEASRTFEGRDKMAPVAAWLSRGIPAEKFGPLLSQWEKFFLPAARVEKRRIQGEVVHIDRFGNLITSIHQRDLQSWMKDKRLEQLTLRVGRAAKPVRFAPTFAASPSKEPIFLIGSSGYVEVAIREDSAASKLRARVGEKIWIEAGERRSGRRRKV